MSKNLLSIVRDTEQTPERPFSAEAKNSWSYTVFRDAWRGV